MPTSPPETLQSAVRERRLFLFVGAGLPPEAHLRLAFFIAAFRVGWVATSDSAEALASAFEAVGVDFTPIRMASSLPSEAERNPPLLVSVAGEPHSQTRAALVEALAEHSLLYYGVHDLPDGLAALMDLLPGGRLPWPGFAIAPDCPPEARATWGERGVTVLDADPFDLLEVGARSANSRGDTVIDPVELAYRWLDRLIDRLPALQPGYTSSARDYELSPPAEAYEPPFAPEPAETIEKSPPPASPPPPAPPPPAPPPPAPGGAAAAPRYEPMRIDAAIPAQVVVEQPFVLAVSVRRPGSPLLNEAELEVVRSSEAEVAFLPGDEPIRLRLRVSAPDCTMDDSDSRSFRLRPGADSPVFYFHLTPRRAGAISIIVQLFQEDDWLASAALRTTAGQTPAGEVKINVVSLTPGTGAPDPALKAQVEGLEAQLQVAKRYLAILQTQLAALGPGLTRAEVEFKLQQQQDLIRQIERQIDALLAPA